MQPNLTDIEILAQQAGAILRARYEKNVEVSHKGSIDLVTDVDRRAEAFLVNAIQTKFPGDQIMAEETGTHAGAGDQLWIIDPLDGTVNYAHGIPVFSVSIAYAVGGQVLLGAVYDPMRDECFSAERGKGAWLNGRSLQAATTDSLGQSLLVTGFSYDIWENPDNNLDHYAKFAVRTQGVRRLGSAALDLCYVGAGRFDGYWELQMQPWDIAAAGLIAEEAGAKVTKIDGSHDYVSASPSILAANPALHQAMFDLLHSE
jgi:myo-inositol-1(or 4)-monophosphatase